MISEKLQKIGLNEKEAKIYTSLLELGETNVQRISKKSKIKRTTIYNVLETLKEKGLISIIIKKKRKYYVATDPRELEYKLEEQKNTLKNLIPELLSITNLIDKKPKIKYFEGEGGIKEICNDTLKKPNSPAYNWNTNYIFDYLEREYLDFYVQQRVKKQIWLYMIAQDTPSMQTTKARDVVSLREIRIDKSKMLSLDVEIILYSDNNIAIISYQEKMGIIIESQKIYNTLKGIFDVCWSNLE